MYKNSNLYLDLETFENEISIKFRTTLVDV
jgi:hypothetical protein